MWGVSRVMLAGWASQIPRLGSDGAMPLLILGDQLLQPLRLDLLDGLEVQAVVISRLGCEPFQGQPLAELWGWCSSEPLPVDDVLGPAVLAFHPDHARPQPLQAPCHHQPAIALIQVIGVAARTVIVARFFATNTFIRTVHQPAARAWRQRSVSSL